MLAQPMCVRDTKYCEFLLKRRHLSQALRFRYSCHVIESFSAPFKVQPVHGCVSELVWAMRCTAGRLSADIS
eukprot:COSAG06_NODE_58342_length_277_cov_0.842697_1_plen_71_part_10